MTPYRVEKGGLNQLLPRGSSDENRQRMRRELGAAEYKFKSDERIRRPSSNPRETQGRDQGRDLLCDMSRLFWEFGLSHVGPLRWYSSRDPDDGDSLPEVGSWEGLAPDFKESRHLSPPFHILSRCKGSYEWLMGAAL